MEVIERALLLAKVDPDEYYHSNEIKAMLENIPTVDAVPVVHGRWKMGREFLDYPRVPYISDAYYCSECKKEAYWDTDYGQQKFDFCPNCGAKMD